MASNDKLFEEFANKIKNIYNEQHKKIISDCNIIKNELFKCLDDKNKIGHYNKNILGKTFTLSSSEIFEKDDLLDNKLLNICDLNISSYENKLSKLSGLKINLDLKSYSYQKFYWVVIIKK